MPDTPDRRSFLAAAGGLLAAGAARAADPPKPITLPEWRAPTERKSAGAPNPLPPEMRVGFAVVGLGRLTLEELLPAFGKAKACKLAALVTGDKDKGLRVARQYGLAEKSVYTYAEFDRVKDDAGVQVVYIVLPNGMHCEYTVRAAAAGKHVLCEKPMANTVAECDEMIAACKKHDKKLMVAYRLQYEPHHRQAIELSRGGSLGALKFITADNGQNHGSATDWRVSKKLAGGGALPDVGVYCLNAARYLTGEEPVEVSASIYSTPGDPRFKEVEENVAFRLKFPSGVIANCTTGYGHFETRRCTVMGEKGRIDMTPAFSYSGIKLAVETAEGMTGYKTERVLGDKDQFATEMDHMARCVLDDRRPHTPGEEGRQDQVVIEAIYKAAETGGTVKLDAVPGKDTTRGPAPDPKG